MHRQENLFFSAFSSLVDVIVSGGDTSTPTWLDIVLHNFGCLPSTCLLLLIHTEASWIASCSAAARVLIVGVSP